MWVSVIEFGKFMSKECLILVIESVYLSLGNFDIHDRSPILIIFYFEIYETTSQTLFIFKFGKL